MTILSSRPYKLVSDVELNYSMMNSMMATHEHFIQGQYSRYMCHLMVYCNGE